MQWLMIYDIYDHTDFRNSQTCPDWISGDNPDKYLNAFTKL